MITARQIEVLCAVIEAGSVTEASERMHLSQPAVSKLIATLERDTGLALFERRNRRLVPTPEADRLYEEARRVFVGLSEINRLAEELRSLKAGALVIASLAALGRGHLPGIMADFLSSRPDISLSYQVRSSSKIMQWAIAQQLDVGVAMLNIDHPAVEMETLCTVDAVCVMPRSHPLTRRDVVNVTDLDGVRFISFGREGRMRHVIETLFEGAGVRPVHVAETFNSETVCSLAAQGFGVGIVEPFSAARFSGEMEIRPFSPSIPYEFKLLFPRFRPRSALASAFSDHLRASVLQLRSLERLGVRPWSAQSAKT